MNDTDIIHSIRQDRYNPAIKRLYMYLPVVKKFITKNSGTRQEAEDIFQESLVIFCNKARNEEFMLSSSINTYLFGICKRLWLDELKKKHKTLTHDFLPIQDDSLGREVSEYVEEDEQVKQAQVAVLKLGAKCRELLELFYFKQLSLKDISVKLGFGSEKTAKNQKYRCLEKARSYYQVSSH